LWGGGDKVSTQIVVLRVRTLHLADLVVVAWSGQPSADAEYRLPPDAPDYPFGFLYPGNDGGRVGVLTPLGVTKAVLYVDGVPQGAVPVDATGFASMRINGQFSTPADQTFIVQLFDASGLQVTTVTVPTRV
jgi:hypothetical protein